MRELGLINYLYDKKKQWDNNGQLAAKPTNNDPLTTRYKLINHPKKKNK